MEYINILEYVGRVENLRRERVFLDRLNPMEQYNDDDFVIRYRFSKNTVLEILGVIREPLRRRSGVDSVLPVTQLLITLRFYATGGFLKLIGDAFGVHVATVSRIVKTVCQCIARERNRYIVFPTGESAARVQREFMGLGQIPGVVGAIDCTHICIQSPSSANGELFRNRKGYFSLNVQAICDSNYKFTNIVVRWPGSTHDARIFENSEVAAKFERADYEGILVGDNGYPLRQYLLTPILQPQTRAEQTYNNNLSQMRVRIENVFGIWKRRFPCLRNQLRLRLQTSMVVVVACAALHNLARDRNEVVPEDGGFIPPQMEDVPVAPVNRNEGGQALRQLIVQRFR